MLDCPLRCHARRLIDRPSAGVRLTRAFNVRSPYRLAAGNGGFKFPAQIRGQ
jgi:hypothetical protein